MIQFTMQWIMNIHHRNHLFISQLKNKLFWVNKTMLWCCEWKLTSWNIENRPPQSLQLPVSVVHIHPPHLENSNRIEKKEELLNSDLGLNPSFQLPRRFCCLKYLWTSNLDKINYSLPPGFLGSSRNLF